MLPQAYASRPYPIAGLSWRLIVLGRPIEGFCTHWEWHERGSRDWRDIRCHPNPPALQLAAILENDEGGTCADYRLFYDDESAPYPKRFAIPYLVLKAKTGAARARKRKRRS